MGPHLCWAILKFFFWGKRQSSVNCLQLDFTFEWIPFSLGRFLLDNFQSVSRMLRIFPQVFGECLPPKKNVGILRKKCRTFGWQAQLAKSVANTTKSTCRTLGTGHPKWSTSVQGQKCLRWQKWNDPQSFGKTRRHKWESSWFYLILILSCPKLWLIVMEFREFQRILSQGCRFVHFFFFGNYRTDGTMRRI